MSKLSIEELVEENKKLMEYKEAFEYELHKGIKQQATIDSMVEALEYVKINTAAHESIENELNRDDHSLLMGASALCKDSVKRINKALDEYKGHKPCTTGGIDDDI